MIERWRCDDRVVALMSDGSSMVQQFLNVSSCDAFFSADADCSTFVRSFKDGGNMCGINQDDVALGL